MLHADDVIYLTSKVSIVLVNEAILAEILGALGNQFPKIVADIATHGQDVGAPALSQAA